MSASNEVRFKIGADTSALSRGFAQAQSIAAAAGQQIHKKLGLGHAMKSMVLAVGIGIPEIADKLSRFFTGMTEDAEEAYRRIVAAGERATQAIARQISARQTAGQQIASLEALNRRESRSGGMQEQSTFQRILAQLPAVGGFAKNFQEHRGIFSAEEIMAARAEESAAAAERSAAIDELKLKEADLARSAHTAALDQELAAKRARGEKNVHDRAEWLKLENQKLDLADEADSKSTSDVRRTQLRLQIEELTTRQLEMTAKARASDRTNAESIQKIQRESAAIGETRGESILRLKREAHDLDRKSRDLTRSEDDRRALRVQAAEKLSAAAKAEYDWRVKTVSLADSLKMPGGGANTTAQGVRARRIASYREKSTQARAEGRYGTAAHYSELANELEDTFFSTDREGMKGAIGKERKGPALSEWDKKYGGQLADRQKRITATYRGQRTGIGSLDLTRRRTTAGKSPESAFSAAFSTTNKHLAEIEKHLKPQKTAKSSAASANDSGSSNK